MLMPWIVIAVDEVGDEKDGKDAVLSRTWDSRKRPDCKVMGAITEAGSPSCYTRGLDHGPKESLERVLRDVRTVSVHKSAYETYCESGSFLGDDATNGKCVCHVNPSLPVQLMLHAVQR